MKFNYLLLMSIVLSVFSACASSSSYQDGDTWDRPSESSDAYSYSNYGKNSGSQGTEPRSSFRSAQPLPRVNRMANTSVELATVVAIAKENSPEQAIAQLDRNPLSFPLNQQNLASLYSAGVNANVMEYLELRAAIDWQSVNSEKQPTYSTLPEPRDETLDSNSQIVSRPEGAVGQVAPVASIENNGRFESVQPNVTYETQSNPVVIYSAPPQTWVGPYYQRRYYAPGLYRRYPVRNYRRQPRRSYRRGGISVSTPNVSLRIPFTGRSRRRARSYSRRPRSRVVRNTRARPSRGRRVSSSGSRRASNNSRGRRRR